MAAPTYATDLTVLDDFESGDNTSEPTGSWTAGRSPTTDTDFPIQSSTHASLTMNNTGKAGLLTDASAVAWTSGDYLFGWLIWLAPGAIATQAAGGLVLLAGSGVGAFKVFYVGGKDFGLYPYGGWQNFVVDPEGTADETQGSPDGDYDFVGAGANVLSAVSKGNPLGMDVFRYGRGEFRVAAGDGTTPGTFTGMAAANDASTARWGLFQAIEGGYKFKGLMILGYAAAVHFDDASKSIVIDNTEFVSSDFNAIEIRNVSSDVTWTGIQIASLSSTSPGTLKVVDNCNVLLDGCQFSDMGAFIFKSNTDALGCKFVRCANITPNNAVLTGSVVEDYQGATNTSALWWATADDPDGNLDDMTFIKGTATTHAISFGTASPLTMTLRGIDFDGYNASDGQNDSALYIARTSGTVTINLVGCSGDISYKSAGATVVLVATVPTKITGVPSGAEWRLYEADATQGIIGSTELDGAESHTGGDITYNDNYTSDIAVALQVMADGYVEFLRYYTLTNAAQTIAVVLTPETNE